jgi:hypothetical protein
LVEFYGYPVEPKVWVPGFQGSRFQEALFNIGR